MSNTVSPPELFLAFRMPVELGALLDGRFVVHQGEGLAPSLSPQARERVRGLVTNGIKGADRALMALFPNLEIIASLGIGLDALDLAAARERKLVVTYTPGVVAEDVADLAMGQVVNLLRRIPQAGAYVHAGQWPGGPFPLARSLTGRKLGIVGMGAIGNAVARRAQAFGMQVMWTGPRAKPALAYPFLDSAVVLARDVDVLVVACSGGPATRHLVNAAVLDALGPEGYLVNVARGSIVDTQALIAALESGRIAGAALDVFEQQPQVPAALLQLGSVLVTPHLGTATRDTRSRMGAMVIQSLVEHFEGRRPQHCVY